VSDETGLQAAVKNVAGIFHIAINANLTPIVDPYVPQAIKETVNVLKAASAEPSVKSVVLTSSSLAGVGWGAKGIIPKDSYNEEVVKLAWDPSFNHPGKAFFVYGAAKTQAEQAAWKYNQEEKPHYTLNTILPSCNFGPSLVYESQGHPSTGGWPKTLFDGDSSVVKDIVAQHFIDVRDTARLHLAALIDPDTSSERLWGFAEPFNWNTVLAIFRKTWPGKKFLEDLPDQIWDESVVSTEGALTALKNVYGQEGWTSLEQSIREAGFDKEAVGGSGKKLTVQGGA
jgi:nucleoside-diphosphate-sugar epimerase